MMICVSVSATRNIFYTFLDSDWLNKFPNILSIECDQLKHPSEHRYVLRCKWAHKVCKLDICLNVLKFSSFLAGQNPLLCRYYCCHNVLGANFRGRSVGVGQ